MFLDWAKVLSPEALAFSKSGKGLTKSGKKVSESAGTLIGNKKAMLNNSTSLSLAGKMILTNSAFYLLDILQSNLI